MAKSASSSVFTGAIRAAALVGAAVIAVGAPQIAAAQSETAAPEAETEVLGPVITEFTLENGLRGVVIEDHRAPVVTHMVWYRVGAADEPPGQSGIAHYLEHLMFKGTDEMGPGEFSRIIAENGGQDNAFTSLDYTAYFQRISVDRLELVMRMEADRMTDLAFDETEALRERDVVLEERSTRTDNNPESQFYEDFSAALYMNHPYGVPVIGWRHEISQVTREQVFDFYRRFYGPENAILVVAGDVEPAEVERLAREIYGSIERRGVTAPPRPTEPPQRAPRRMTFTDERIRQPYVIRAYLTPSYVTGGQRVGAAHQLLAEILGGSAASRFDEAFVRGEGLAINAAAYYWGTARDMTQFGIYAVPVDGVSLETVEAAMDRTLAEFQENGPTAEELARAQSVLISRRVYQQDSQSSMARLYGGGLVIGLSVDEIRDWPQTVASITAEEIREAARNLRLEASVTGWLQTAPQEEAAQ